MSYQAKRYYGVSQDQKPITIIQHSNGTVLYTAHAMGGDVEIAESAPSAMEALTAKYGLGKQSDTTTLDAKSQRFLQRRSV